MGEPKHVIIVGSGLIGLSTAFYLQRDGWAVTIVERQTLGSGASRGNAGEITPQSAIPLAGPGMVGETLQGLVSRKGPLSLSPWRAMRLTPFGAGFMWSSLKKQTAAGVATMGQLARGSFDSFDELAAAGVDVGGGGQGFLYTARTTEALTQSHEFVQAQAAAGLGAEPGPILTGEQVREFEPALSPSVQAAFLAPSERWLTPARFVDSLGRLLRERGVQILEHTEVTTVVGGATPQVSVRGPEGFEILTADRVVVAAGAWSQELLKQHGIHLGVVPGKGYSFNAPMANPPKHLIHMTDARAVAVPMDGQVRFVGIMEIDGTYDTFHPDRIEVIKNLVSPMLPEVDWQARTNEWVGPRPMTADGLPVIGDVPGQPGVLVATGHNMHGLSLGPVTGLVLAQHLAGSPVLVAGEPVDLAAFSPTRQRRWRS